MARYLFASTPAFGHFQPMAPLAYAARRAGHDVVVATGADFAWRVRETGLDVVEVGPSLEEAAAPRAQSSVDTTRQVRRWGTVTLVRSFAGPWSAQLAEELVPFAKDWQPDVVVHDSTNFAAPVAARCQGVPSVLHTFGPVFPDRVVDLCAETAAPMWRRWGLEPSLTAGMRDSVFYDVWPEPLYGPDVTPHPQRRPIRPDPIPATSGECLPDTITESSHPVVAFTLGTVLEDQTELRRRVIDAAAELPVTLAVTVGPTGDLDALGDVPSNVVVAHYLPHSHLMAKAACAISHAGNGSVLAAIAHAVPQLLLPQDADQFFTARLCTGAGIGTALSRHARSVEGLRAAIAGLLDDDQVKRSAAKAAQAVSAMPQAADVLADLDTRLQLAVA